MSADDSGLAVQRDNQGTSRLSIATNKKLAPYDPASLNVPDSDMDINVIKMASLHLSDPSPSPKDAGRGKEDTTDNEADAQLQEEPQKL